MATKYTTDNRDTLITINNKGPFIVSIVNYTETISEGAKLIADFVTDKTFETKDLGQVVQVEHKISDKEKINFYLLSTEINYCGSDEIKGLNHYQIIAEDPLSILKQCNDMKIYQKKNTKAIIEEILTDVGLNKYFKFSVSGTGATREFCVRFKENGYDFIKRLCSEEGWHFHCEHQSSVQLVIADNNNAFTSYKNNNISYLNPTIDISDVLLELHCCNTIGTNNISLLDFSYVNGKTFDNKEKSTINQTLNLSLKDFGSSSKDKTEISNLSKTIVSGIDTSKELYFGKSEIKNLACGMKFTLKNHPESKYNQEYIIISIKHILQDIESGVVYKYSNEFTCIPSKVTYKPLYISAPQFNGTLTATVTGPSGKEIYTDDKGRIKVLMHFDSDTKPDENSSIWIPVAQTFTGNGYGSFFLPRVGTTVVVTFLNGDINKPLVISSIYTDDLKLPFTKNTQSGFKTHSHQNGGQTDCNELRFEDQKDAEQIYIHAQKDILSEVENDVKESIKGNKEITIEKKYTTSAKEDVSHSTEKTFVITSKDNYSVSTDKDSTTTVKGNTKLKTDGDIEEKAGKNISIGADKDIKIDGKNITITGNSNISLTVGGSKIEITSSGITIKSSSITINGQTTKIEATSLSEKGTGSVKINGAQINIKADATAEMSGAMTTIKGDAKSSIESSGICMVKGSLTKIN